MRTTHTTETPAERSSRPDPWLAAATPLFRASTATAPILDLACGRGRNSLWLASLGFPVCGVDISEEALGHAREQASRRGLSRALFRVADVESEGVPPGPWGGILVFHFLARELFDQLQGALVPGGLLAYKTHLRHRLREPGAHPRRAAYLLEPGELLSAFPRLETLAYREWVEAPSAFAGLAARHSL